MQLNDLSTYPEKGENTRPPLKSPELSLCGWSHSSWDLSTGPNLFLTSAILQDRKVIKHDFWEEPATKVHGFNCFFFYIKLTINGSEQTRTLSSPCWFPVSYDTPFSPRLPLSNPTCSVLSDTSLPLEVQLKADGAGRWGETVSTFWKPFMCCLACRWTVAMIKCILVSKGNG